jgi:hypothetical protein
MGCDQERKGKWKKWVIDGQETRKRKLSRRERKPILRLRQQSKYKASSSLISEGELEGENNLNTELGSAWIYSHAISPLGAGQVLARPQRWL